MRVKTFKFMRPTTGALLLGAAAMLWACSTPTGPAPAVAQAPAAAPTPPNNAPVQAPAAATPAAAAAAPAASGTDMAHAKQTFESLCNGCHESALATSMRNNRSGWEQVVDRMYGFGLAASDAQAKEIIDYLTATYPAS